MLRPAEQLYRTEEDPYEMVNLADDPELAKTFRLAVSCSGEVSSHPREDV
ncbi:hypothetical protein Pla100_61790 [Neorhodopirellula pilleata]|uniref:Sulfatase n=1 Tax=Neorhodopirellula pilleata TaxID=2714738 RepID=A0A5C5ZFH5_9BACT|nr:hypothetical protein Pla100_61790 [Neorhodopirellula pilleata]